MREINKVQAMAATTTASGDLPDSHNGFPLRFGMQSRQDEKRTGQESFFASRIRDRSREQLSIGKLPTASTEWH